MRAEKETPKRKKRVTKKDRRMGPVLVQLRSEKNTKEPAFTATYQLPFELFVQLEKEYSDFRVANDAAGFEHYIKRIEATSPERAAGARVLTATRISAGLTQKRFGQILGISQFLVSKMERGVYRITEEVASNVEKHFDVPQDCLLEHLLAEASAKTQERMSTKRKLSKKSLQDKR